MFVRFRLSGHRLQVSLIESRRHGGRPRHEHIAGLGSVEMPPSVEARLAFWKLLHERLAKLSNRIDAAAQGKILGAVHSRIPMVTLDEQRAVQIENAEADERFWAGLRDTNEASAEDHKALGASADRAAADMQANANEAAVNAAEAKERAERIRRGEDVPGGLGKPLTFEDYERIIDGIAGKGFAQHAHRLNEVCKAFGFKKVLKTIQAEKDRAERAIICRLHRHIGTVEPGS